ncbi:acid protease [Polyplosphaeria fusca]|uniref:Acid protease n=1 Tax=Polyplosphaeria fusca TaxID=682080 RepID=A0A9P4V2R1_9PLEO|nr:acid protease [Polyplosphaeria fusca]
MTNLTLAGSPYTLVIDTGSSDTWVAGSGFQCLSRYARTPLRQESCGFGTLYGKEDSPTWSRIPTHDFQVRYTDGEYLTGDLGTEELTIGGLQVRQTIGVVEQGWWIGDQISSGLMGLAYPILASGHRDLNYTSVVFSLFEDGTVPPVFSLALSRPTPDNPMAGGFLALGGVPDTGNDASDFVTVPIKPVISTAYAFYSILVDGVAIFPPGSAEERGEALSPDTERNHTNTSRPLILTNPLRPTVDQFGSILDTPTFAQDQTEPATKVSLNEIGRSRHSIFSSMPRPSNPAEHQSHLAKFTSSQTYHTSTYDQTTQQSVLLQPTRPPSTPLVNSRRPSIPVVQSHQAPRRSTKTVGPSISRKGKAKSTHNPPWDQSTPLSGLLLAPRPRPSPTADPDDNVKRQADFTSLDLNMVIDSGTTLIYLPDAVASYIASLFDPPAIFNTLSNLYVVSCNAQAPRIAIIIAGQPFYIDERDLLNGGGVAGQKGVCVVAVQKQGNGDAVLGDAFLKNVVAVFDVGRNEMSFAARGVY